MGKRRASQVYSVHPVVSYAQTVVANMPEKTGRALEEWCKLVEAANLTSVKEARAWLKGEYGLGMTTANLVAERTLGDGDAMLNEKAYLRRAPEYVDEMYAGPKAALRGIHDALIDLARSMGNDVRISPCTTIVPCYREHVFAEIKPSTRTRVDLGLALKGCSQKLVRRLVDTGGIKKGNRITHRFPISSLDEIDDQVRRWVQIAYDLDAPN